MGAQRALMMFFQTPYDAGVAHDVHWIMIAELVLAVTLIVVLVAALIGGLVVWAKINRLIEDAKKAATPAIAKGTELFNDLAPKVRSITSNVEQISFTARDKATEFSETLSQINKTVADVNGKAKAQAARVDGMVTSALDTTHHVSQTIQHGIRVPINKIAGLVAGIRTGFEHFVESSPLASFLRHRQSTGTGQKARPSTQGQGVSYDPQDPHAATPMHGQGVSFETSARPKTASGEESGAQGASGAQAPKSPYDL